MTPTVTELLREIVLETGVPATIRRKALDLLISMSVSAPVLSVDSSAYDIARNACQDVPIEVGADLAGLKKIEAIKMLRQRMPQFGLKDAKDRVDALEACGRVTFFKYPSGY
jgi:ribosomal protein L7/L12